MFWWWQIKADAGNQSHNMFWSLYNYYNELSVNDLNSYSTLLLMNITIWSLRATTDTACVVSQPWHVNTWVAVKLFKKLNQSTHTIIYTSEINNEFFNICYGQLLNAYDNCKLYRIYRSHRRRLDLLCENTDCVCCGFSLNIVRWITPIIVIRRRVGKGAIQN